jgi:hypothetical protein
VLKRIVIRIINETKEDMYNHFNETKENTNKQQNEVKKTMQDMKEEFNKDRNHGGGGVKLKLWE